MFEQRSSLFLGYLKIFFSTGEQLLSKTTWTVTFWHKSLHWNMWLSFILACWGGQRRLLPNQVTAAAHLPTSWSCSAQLGLQEGLPHAQGASADNLQNTKAFLPPIPT